MIFGTRTFGSSTLGGYFSGSNSGTITVWTGSTKNLSEWTVETELPQVWTPNPETKVPASWSLTPRSERTWRSTDTEQVPYLYDDATKTYDSAGIYYDYLNITDNQTNNDNPTIWTL